MSIWTSICNRIIVVQHPSENLLGVGTVDGMVKLVSVPDEVDIVARYEKYVWLALFQEQKLLVSIDGVFQKCMAPEVRQRNLVEEVQLADDAV